MDAQTERANLLKICRSVMPGVAGVVLASPAGAVVAHETGRVRDPNALATEAVHARAGEIATSALVPRDDGLYLVVFVPAPLVEQWSAPSPLVPA